MPQRIPMPDCLSFFIMVGNETAEVAAHIASSVRDHCGDPDFHAVNCLCLVDDRFDGDSVMEQDLYYQCPAPMSESLLSTALQVVQTKLQQTMETVVNLPSFPFQMNKILFVIVADAAGAWSPECLGKLREVLTAEMRADGRQAGALLCITAGNSQAQAQRQRLWLMDEAGQLRPEINGFEKVLILTPQNKKGISTLSTARDMLDVAFPALIMMMNGYMFTEPSRLYTAAYKKQGGTSNDIQELRRHIAASALEGFFANRDALSKREVLEILSTDKIKLDESGNTLLDKAMNCASRYIPELRHLVLTADLEDKDFDPVAHIVDFDEMNRRRMCEIGDWPEEWLEAVKKNVSQCIHPDAVLYQLEDNNPGNMVTEILQTWSALMSKVTGEGTQTREYVARRMEAGRQSHKKGLLQKTRDYNLILLSAAMEVYADICRERIAYRILSCLRDGLPPLRAYIARLTERRHTALEHYQMSDSKAEFLKKACPAAARELEDSYTRPGLIDNLPTYIQYRSSLHAETGRSRWASLYQEFLSRGTQTSSFSDAFILNETEKGIRKKVEPLGEDVQAMIPSWPDELGPMQQPVKAFLLNNAVADMMEETLQESQVYHVPGDLLEHVSLFPLSMEPDALTKLSMFRETPGISRPAAVSPVSAVGKKTPDRVSVETVPEVDLNPWNIQIMDSPKGKMLCWDYPADHSDAVIRINGRTIRENYSYNDYIAKGKGLLLEDGQLPSGVLTIEIECGTEYQQYSKENPSQGEPVSVICGSTKAKGNNGLEFVCGSASADRYDNRCIVFADDREHWRIPFGLNENNAIGPLWCETISPDLVLEDL